uniref:UPAR/Ly6 domain-containing protein n=1 Tax=Panagrolaimus sp. ES5 TaxID=591445 RepID=A0AC34EZC2_9BILA
MKTFIFSLFALLCCLSIADGLKCVTSFPHVDASTKECDSDAKYCYTFNGKMRFPEFSYEGTVQNCAIDIAGIDLCKQKGNNNFDNLLIKGSMYCCDKDLCNSSPKTISAITISAFVLITTFLFL